MVLYGYESAYDCDYVYGYGKCEGEGYGRECGRVVVTDIGMCAVRIMVVLSCRVSIISMVVIERMVFVM